ncbi:AtpZ/AtpI family protein [Jannaschia sp. CCS1]|uniref:AtpZ/AtpI family protein n=1 Tax=Jannaschia sp. (strain CCS1) TaxID=290400 RepID=UPI000053B01B|nr:AtpZ/AtpI family protein [Jannaschia sp. CCS1]ABD53683.1 ATP synthase F0 subunit I [Jannaschia sp. CCS1]
MAQSDEDRMQALEARIAAAKSRANPERSQAGEQHSQAQLAWRMVIELVAGLGIGFGIGYGLDWAFGTTPWLMVVFVLLGFIAGVKTMIGSAKEVQQDALEREEIKTRESAGQETGTQDGD